nr:ATP-binding cassette domain-containing protein [uncultured Chryseobacterium sp.]
MSRLHIDSITKSFGQRKILQDIYLSLETGKTAGLIGRNGCGKSTLLQIIFGTTRGNNEYIKFNDTVLINQFDRNSRIVYLPQYPFLPKNVKVKNLVHLFCNPENSEVIKKSDLTKSFINKTSHQLSGGEVRLLETMLIIFSSAEFVLLDEPFHSLSPKTVSEVKKIILEQSKYKGFIISGHQYQDILDISDDLYLLADSHLKLIKDLAELKKYNYLSKNI